MFVLQPSKSGEVVHWKAVRMDLFMCTQGVCHWYFQKGQMLCCNELMSIRVRIVHSHFFVESTISVQSYNRLAYAYNNPLKYTDPSGEFIFTTATIISAFFTGGTSLSLLPVAIGADLGMWQGGVLANKGEMNPFQWNYSSGKTWGYMLGGAAVGAASGYIGGQVAAAGGALANTDALVTSSSLYSMGTAFYTGFQTDVTISFGVGSFNLSEGKVRGLWNWNDLSTGERIGYILGTMANVSDIGTRGNMLFNVEKNDLINHAAIKDINGSTIISFGPGDSPKYDYLLDNKTGVITSGKHYGKLLFGVRGSNDYPIHGRDIFLKGVNTTVIKGYGKILTYLSHKGLIPYSFIYSSCSTHVGLALWFSGVPNLFIHPYTLQVSVWLWNHGITSYLIQNSYHLIINKQR